MGRGHCCQIEETGKEESLLPIVTHSSPHSQRGRWNHLVYYFPNAVLKMNSKTSCRFGDTDRLLMMNYGIVSEAVAPPTGMN